MPTPIHAYARDAIPQRRPHTTTTTTTTTTTINCQQQQCRSSNHNNRTTTTTTTNFQVLPIRTRTTLAQPGDVRNGSRTKKPTTITPTIQQIQRDGYHRIPPHTTSSIWNTITTPDNHMANTPRPSHNTKRQRHTLRIGSQLSTYPRTSSNGPNNTKHTNPTRTHNHTTHTTAQVSRRHRPTITTNTRLTTTTPPRRSSIL